MEIIDSKLISNETIANLSSTYTLTIPKPVASTWYKCVIRFTEAMKPVSTNASTKPNFTFTWISPVISNSGKF